MSNSEERGRAQYEISQKRINAMATWLDTVFPEAKDKITQDFINVYNQMLSSLGEKQKSAPADLYKLNSYWELQKNVRESLQSFGEVINAQFNEQLRLVYIDIYEGCKPGEEKTCTVSEHTIQAVINKSRGRAAHNSQEYVWIHLTILWDKLFGDLMHCTIKNLSPENLLLRLQVQFDTTEKKMKTSFSDSATFIQTRAVIRRGKDDREEEAAIALANIVEEENTPAPRMMMMRRV